MEALGGELIASLSSPAVVHLRGELGTGKTTLVRGALRSLGHLGLVKSPTFTIVESYTIASLHIHHFDLYRISDPEELDFIGIREYLTSNSTLFFEWPEQGKTHIPVADVAVDLQHAGTARRVTINRDLK